MKARGDFVSPDSAQSSFILAENKLKAICIMVTKSVLIVGAGPSGLTALKEMRALGIDAFAIDTRAEIGGVFAQSASNVTYDNLHLTIPNMFMAFSDFPPKDTHVKYWSKDEYADYLQEYAEHFNLLPYLRLNTYVTEAKMTENEAWQVTSVCCGKQSVYTCDFLIVATGANHAPHLPKEQLLPNYAGEILHSSEYHNASQVKDQRVLVIGMGESSVDVACSAATTAASTAIWGRRFPDMAPRFIPEFMRNHNYDEEAKLTNQEGLLPKDCLDSITTSRIVRNLPLAAWNIALHGLKSDMKSFHGPSSHGETFHDLLEKTWEGDWFSTDAAEVPCKSDVLYRPASDGKLDIVIAPQIRAEGKTVQFEGPQFFGRKRTSQEEEKTGRSIDVDVIVACTGFRINFGWLKAPVSARPRTWFKHCFPPNLGHRMAFLGYARPHQGGIPQVAEMLARYIGQLLVGNLTLPNDYAALAIKEGKNETECIHFAPHMELVVDYYGIMLSVASLMGCEPKVPYDIAGICQTLDVPYVALLLPFARPGC